MGIRKNQRDLTAAEKRAFVNAVLELKNRPARKYDEYVRTHNQFIMSDRDNGVRIGHRSPSFLPWHRQFLLDFERDLQAIDPAVNLPYWNWTTDRTPTASLWRADFLGGNGRSSDAQVMTGPFAFSGGQWTIAERGQDSRRFLMRRLAGSGTDLPTASQLNQVLGLTPYDVAPWNSTSASGFRNQVEGWRGPNLHNRVHVWVGGQMQTGVSPNDPVFWLHHCFIDKVWSDWQRAHPSSGYLPTGDTSDVVDVDEAMPPWGTVTPRDMLDHEPFYTYA